jgi:micrococcal nuclease
MRWRRNLFLSTVLVVIVASSFGLGYLTTKVMEKKPPEALEQLPTAQEESKVTLKETPLGVTELKKVTRVIDGDTIEIEGGASIRYIGINTPETNHPSLGKECYGEQAKEANRLLVEGQMVRLEKDVSETDRYGRLLRYVYVGDIFVNDYLVREGFAFASSYPPDVKHQERFVAAQREALEKGRGLWQACKVSDNQKNILDYRKQNGSGQEMAVENPEDSLSTIAASEKKEDVLNTQQQSPVSVTEAAKVAADSIECKIKGNISSSGKIYHLPECKSYEKTVIDTVAGERWFCSEEEAVAAGWRKAKNC